MPAAHGLRQRQQQDEPQQPCHVALCERVAAGRVHRGRMVAEILQDSRGLEDLTAVSDLILAVGHRLLPRPCQHSALNTVSAPFNGS